MVKKDYIDFFNTLIRGGPISLQKIIPMISEYLTEIKYENSDKVINLIVQNPQLIQNAIPEVIEYYCRKYDILSIKQRTLNSFNNNLKTILYYE